jgi:hypothetical protein
LLSSATIAQIDDPSDYRKLLVGNWKVDSTEITSQMNETFAVFTDDSIYVMRIPFDYYGLDTINLRFKYTLKADEIKIYKTLTGEPEIHKIVKLTATELVLRHKENICYRKLR